MVTVHDIRRLALSLPRTHEAVVRDRVKFRVGGIVYLSLAPDETSMGFAFPKDERNALIAAHPDRFYLPIASDLRYNWVRAWLARLPADDLPELVQSAWAMAVPKSVVAAHLADSSTEPERDRTQPP